MVESSAAAVSGRILFQLTGSIACFKACWAISKLVQAGYQVQIAATQAALKFVGEATLEGLTGRKVFTDLFEPGHAMDHIHWARWADLSIICPASAGTINRLAAGIADDVVGTLFLAQDPVNRQPPCWIVPAMNALMWNHPATRERGGGQAQELGGEGDRTNLRGSGLRRSR